MCLARGGDECVGPVFAQKWGRFAQNRSSLCRRLSRRRKHTLRELIKFMIRIGRELALVRGRLDGFGLVVKGTDGSS